MKRIIALLIVLALSAACFTACGKSGLTEDEIRALFCDLVERSYPLNTVYYGDGLPTTEDQEILEELLGFSPDETGLVMGYLPVTKEAEYQSEDEIRAATAEIYSPEMCELLYEIAFRGISTEDETKVAFARYIQQGEYLTARVDLSEDAIDVGRTYDFDSMTVIVDEPERIRASFASEVDGKPSVTVKITIVKTADGWRLDSPTY